MMLSGTYYAKIMLVYRFIVCWDVLELPVMVGLVVYHVPRLIKQLQYFVIAG